MKRLWYQNKWVKFFLHAACWLLLFSLPALLRPSYNPGDVAEPHLQDATTSFVIARINDGFLICFFYLNALLFIPRLFYPKKYFFYLIALVCCFVIFATQGWILRTSFLTDEYFTLGKHLFFNIFIFIFILACSTAYKTIGDKILAEKIATEKENEFLKTELSLLRSQVSPHFMFNVLNNMVALARKKSDQLEPSLIKLSSLMRYMLYDTGEQKVSLEKESEYLQSYIDLQQQRFGKKVTINVGLQPADDRYFIEPMLLIPFVENAFKHGTGMIEHAQIDISLRAFKNRLHFLVKNKFNAHATEIKDNASGIGLANVHRRLQLLYGSAHELTIKQEADFFIVSLQITLSK